MVSVHRKETEESGTSMGFDFAVILAISVPRFILSSRSMGRIPNQLSSSSDGRFDREVPLISVR